MLAAAPSPDASEERFAFQRSDDQRLLSLLLHAPRYARIMFIDFIRLLCPDGQQFAALTLEEYVDIICAQLELLPPELIIQRVTGDGARDTLIAPLWSLKKFVVMNEIDKKLARDDTMQGSKYCGK